VLVLHRSVAPAGLLGHLPVAPPMICAGSGDCLPPRRSPGERRHVGRPRSKPREHPQALP
jgi:hypothetical protein